MAGLNIYGKCLTYLPKLLTYPFILTKIPLINFIITNLPPFLKFATQRIFEMQQLTV